MRGPWVRWALPIAALLLVGVLTVRAEPLAQRSVQITSPEVGAELRGVVPIIGSASVPDFQFYKVEFGVGPNPAQWALIGSLHETPVINGQLEVWDTTRLPDGVYSLRLQAVKRDGNYDEFFVRQLAIVNTRPSPTPTEEATPTPTETPAVAEATRTLPPQQTPEATPTFQIIAPTAGILAATPTPTLSRPVQRQLLPVNPEGWGQAFCSGALAMGAVFLVLGIVFGLRRLL